MTSAIDIQSTKFFHEFSAFENEENEPIKSGPGALLIPDIQKLIVRMAAGTLQKVNEPKKGYQTLTDVREIYANIKDLSNMLHVVDDIPSKKNHLILWHQLEKILREDLCSVIEKVQASFEDQKKALEELTKIFAEPLMKKDEIVRMKKETLFYITTVTPRMEAVLQACYQVMQVLDSKSPCISALKSEIAELFRESCERE